MDVKGKVETLDSLIRNEQGFIKMSLIQAIIPFIIGMTATILLLIWALSDKNQSAESSALQETTKALSAIPGLLVTAYSIFSIKDYFSRKNRITCCKFLRVAYESSEDGNVPAEIEQRFWSLLDKSLA
jgi:hypothetical protein